MAVRTDSHCPMTDDGRHDLSYCCGWYCPACMADLDDTDPDEKETDG
jgi:hypothetical protein